MRVGQANIANNVIYKYTYINAILISFLVKDTFYNGLLLRTKDAHDIKRITEKYCTISFLCLSMKRFGDFISHKNMFIVQSKVM